MRPRLRWLVVGLALVLAGACSRPGEDSAAAGDGPAPTALDRAVAIARAIQAAPAAADSILAAHRLTPAEFDSLLYDIAADSAMARSYAEAIR